MEPLNTKEKDLWDELEYTIAVYSMRSRLPHNGTQISV